MFSVSKGLTKVSHQFIALDTSSAVLLKHVQRQLLPLCAACLTLLATAATDTAVAAIAAAAIIAAAIAAAAIIAAAIAALAFVISRF